MSAAELHQALTGRPHPLAATEHPIRCAATLEPLVGEGHEHWCAYPAKRPADVVGILEHQCGTCGCTWTESTEQPPPDKSWLVMGDVSGKDGPSWWERLKDRLELR